MARTKMKTKTTPYDVAEHLRTPEEMAAYLDAAIEEAGDDAAFVARALGDVARAKGMSLVAREAGVSRESLYKALSGERTPSFETVLKIIDALGLSLHCHAHGEARAARAGAEGKTRERLTARSRGTAMAAPLGGRAGSARRKRAAAAGVSRGERGRR